MNGDMRARAERLGHDGIIISSNQRGEAMSEVVAFSPAQIKSATGNVGTFDAANPDIRFSRVTQTTTEQVAPL